MVFLAGKSPNIRTHTVYIYGSGQPYIRASPAFSSKNIAAVHRKALIGIKATRYRTYVTHTKRVATACVNEMPVNLSTFGLHSPLALIAA
jgi:hypothetical protein